MVAIELTFGFLPSLSQHPLVNLLPVYFPSPFHPGSGAYGKTALLLPRQTRNLHDCVLTAFFLLLPKMNLLLRFDLVMSEGT